MTICRGHEQWLCEADLLACMIHDGTGYLLWQNRLQVLEHSLCCRLSRCDCQWSQEMIEHKLIRIGRVGLHEDPALHSLTPYGIIAPGLAIVVLPSATLHAGLWQLSCGFVPTHKQAHFLIRSSLTLDAQDGSDLGRKFLINLTGPATPELP